MSPYNSVDVENHDFVQARAQFAWKPENTGFRALLIADYSQKSNDGVSRVGVRSPTSPNGPTIWSGTRALIPLRAAVSVFAKAIRFGRNSKAT